MKDILVPVVPESSESQDLELVVIAINTISLQLCSQYVPTLFQSFVAALKLGIRNCAANARDDIYLEMQARPQNRGSSNTQLQGDIDELLQERISRQGNHFRTLHSKRQPEHMLDAVTILRGLKHSLGLQIVDYSTDTEVQLIAACGIALSQLGRVIAYEPTCPFVRYCWLVQDRLERFPRSRCLAPIRPPVAQSSQQAMTSEILSIARRVEQKIDDLPRDQSDQDVKNNLNLSVRVDKIEQLELHQLLPENTRNQNAAPCAPPPTPVRQSPDDGQHADIYSSD
ncbi:hypothetical protein BFJ66_g13039 [Fusarium oxysporum f. sp. cepae]|uniref:Uncharacterized protein n=1 Tax=Fusarium oxysporum f. sp. cepae TaxID=396571 RepID=A0A3L6NNM2_FUSOX|nr:hypothetical protein BFJ65_g6180 [Fusarium oxysporum f. sp. cepae]RKK30920.1 hypothetical protein BFJ67_g15496 [Fusarium oxysporum f. sp. cepae]RKK37270.1 hypothetical protein BFJ66_g13039 [Fusarium oxysporum f. sp. cepae]